MNVYVFPTEFEAEAVRRVAEFLGHPTPLKFGSALKMAPAVYTEIITKTRTAPALLMAVEVGEV